MFSSLIGVCLLASLKVGADFMRDGSSPRGRKSIPRKTRPLQSLYGELISDRHPRVGNRKCSVILASETWAAPPAAARLKLTPPGLSFSRGMIYRPSRYSFLIAIDM